MGGGRLDGLDWGRRGKLGVRRGEIRGIGGVRGKTFPKK